MSSRQPKVSPNRLRQRIWQQFSRWGFIAFCCLGLMLAIGFKATTAHALTPAQASDIVPKSILTTPSDRSSANQLVASSIPARASLPLPQIQRRVGTQVSATSPNGEASPTILAQATEPLLTTQPVTASDKSSTPLSQYIMEFNRSPVVGNRLQLNGIYPETRLGFTRPTHWQVRNVKVLLRFQHSPALLADKSYLTLKVNDTSVGSVPLDTSDAQVSEATFEVPARLIQDFNELSVAAVQQISAECTNPSDPRLWTEILPDSKVFFNYEPQPVTLDFSRFPYPFIDPLNLDANRLAYLKPTAMTSHWLNEVAQLQTVAGRLSDYKPLSTRLINDTRSVVYNDGIIIIGTPTEQPILQQLSLPFALKNGQWLDGQGKALPADTGLLMLTAIEGKGSPVLVVSGNQPEGLAKAVQALVRSSHRQLGTGQAILVREVADRPALDPRDWPGYLPISNAFELSQLQLPNGQPFPETIAVNGTSTPAIDIPFKALPNDRFIRGSSMTLDYSYSAQVNPRTSAVEVKLDGTTIASKRLKAGGRRHERFKLDLPGDLIKSDSRLQVQFLLFSRENERCGLVTDDQLWGELHNSTQFNLNRDVFTKLPDLGLFKTGFPLTMPQDLSEAAIAMPNQPTNSELETLLALSERLGRLSRSDAVALTTYRANDIPADLKAQKHWVAIGLRSQFPMPDVFQSQGFDLADNMGRQWQAQQLQALVDNQGVVQTVISPWNPKRVLIAFTAQTDLGMLENRNLLNWDELFYRLQGDTVLINRTQSDPSPYNPGDYQFESLSRAKTTEIANTTWVKRIFFWLQQHWLFVPVGAVLVAMLLYGISQLYLNRAGLSNEGVDL
jgi:cellulose synthase operon protein B